MAKKKSVYEKLLQGGFSKREIHSALHKCVLEIQNRNNEMLILKQVQDVQHDDSNKEMLILKQVQNIQYNDHQIKQKINNVGQEMLILKQVQDVKHDVVQHDDITPAKNHPHPVVYFFKKVNIRKHVIGKALSLLRSQFAKKPKNPV